MLDLMNKLHKWWKHGGGRTAAAALCAHSVSVSIGVCQGYSAILVPQLTASPDFHITADQGSWLASLGAVSNPVGSILSGVLAEYAGRRRSIQLSSVPFLVGWLCIALGPDLRWLYAGRLITGVAAGMSSACYTYVSEVSEPARRGWLQALGPVCASLGILLTYTLGWLLGWRQVARLSAALCLLTAAAAQPLPESPPHLLRRGRRQDATDAYAWLRGSRRRAALEVEAHLREHSSSQDDKEEAEVEDGGGRAAKGGGGAVTWRDYASPACVKPLLILVTLFLLQELSGIYSILYYTVSFFEETGVSMDEYLSSILVGGVRLAMAVVAAFLINRFGRRTLCMASAAGMAASMLALSAYFRYAESRPLEPRPVPTLPLYLVALNVLCSMVGMLPVPWVLVGEMFPLRVRPIMAGVVICAAQCFIFVCVKIYPDLVTLLGFSGTLFTFLAASLATVVFCRLCLPETKGKTLADIERYFRGEDDGKPSKGKLDEDDAGNNNNNNNNNGPAVVVVVVVGGPGGLVGGHRGGEDDNLGCDNRAFDAAPETSCRTGDVYTIKDVDR